MQHKKFSFTSLKNRSLKAKTLLKLPGVLTGKEKKIFLFFVLVFVAAAGILLVSFWQSNTVVVPSSGGAVKEGVVGQPRFLNPVYAASNDVDRDLVSLVYSGLFKYDSEGKIAPDIAKDYQISQDGKTYVITLRDDIFFHDGQKLNADDVIFTIKTVQNPDFKSPIQLRWLDVGMKKISDHQIKFILQNAYPAFLETLTLKILPAHIWQDIPAANFPLSPYNYKPIGSGPYKFADLSQDKTGRITSLTLEKFHNYHNALPYINQFSFLFFESQEELINAAENNVIDSFAGTPYLLEVGRNFQEYSFTLPRYFAVFFNPQENELLQEKEIRLALSQAINREEIIEKALAGRAQTINSLFVPQAQTTNSLEEKLDFKALSYDPKEAEKTLNKAGFRIQDNKLVKIEKAETMNFTKDLTVGSRDQQVTNLQKCLSEMEGIYPEKQVTGYFGNSTKAAVIRFQEEYAQEILAPSGLDAGNGRVGPRTREKLNKLCVTSPEETTPFTITLTTTEDPILQEVAHFIKEQWSKIGISTEIESFSVNAVKQEVIRERDYQALLFGQVLGLMPDPYPFWHSSQREYPGLNLSDYRNKTVDVLLEEARTEQDPIVRQQLYQETQEILLNDVPAAFLYNPDLVYLASNKIKGIEPSFIADPSQRFTQVENWYINTKRKLE